MHGLDGSRLVALGKACGDSIAEVGSCGHVCASRDAARVGPRVSKRGKAPAIFKRRALPSEGRAFDQDDEGADMDLKKRSKFRYYSDNPFHNFGLYYYEIL